MRQWSYRSRPTLTHNDASQPPTTRNEMRYLTAFSRYRPEAGILSGVTWKCSMRSAFYWFTEFCHSQGLSHFAASFIVTRAEASIAKSCEIIFQCQIRVTILDRVDKGLTTGANRESPASWTTAFDTPEPDRSPPKRRDNWQTHDWFRL